MTHKSTAKIAVGLAATVAIFDVSVAPARSQIFDARHALAAASATVMQGYRAAPALVLVMGIAIFILVMVAMIAAARSILDLPWFNSRRLARLNDGRDAEAAEDIANSDTGQAYIEVQIGNRDVRCALLSDMLRIGREDDNDIRIPSDAVARYHAAIHREDYDDWHITEIAGTTGKGLIVNGRPCGEARLRDGDVIEVGPGRLRFHAGFA